MLNRLLVACMSFVAAACAVDRNDVAAAANDAAHAEVPGSEAKDVLRSDVLVARSLLIVNEPGEPVAFLGALGGKRCLVGLGGFVPHQDGPGIEMYVDEGIARVTLSAGGVPMVLEADGRETSVRVGGSRWVVGEGGELRKAEGQD